MRRGCAQATWVALAMLSTGCGDGPIFDVPVDVPVDVPAAGPPGLAGERLVVEGLEAIVSFGPGPTKGVGGDAPRPSIDLLLSAPPGPGGWVTVVVPGPGVAVHAGAEGVRIQCTQGQCDPGGAWWRRVPPTVWATEIGRSTGSASYLVRAIGGGSSQRAGPYRLVGGDATLVLCFSPGAAPLRFETETGLGTLPFSAEVPTAETPGSGRTTYDLFPYGVTSLHIPPGDCTSIPSPAQLPLTVHPREAR